MTFTYFGVLLCFLVPLILLFFILDRIDAHQGRRLDPQHYTGSAGLALLAHVIVAVVYTTPWDNYLVANRIWWYKPELVTGITLGWVPIEEYTFFVLQTLLTGLWMLAWARRLPGPATTAPSRIRLFMLIPTGLLWLISTGFLIAGVPQTLYMSILLTWALPPILLQLAFGGDLLWRYRRLVTVGLLPPFLYLSLVDALAISGGTWTINPANTVGIHLGGVLPLEEFVFFFITNVLIVFGMTLLLARESRNRLNFTKG